MDVKKLLDYVFSTYCPLRGRRVKEDFVFGGYMDPPECTGYSHNGRDSKKCPYYHYIGGCKHPNRR